MNRVSVLFLLTLSLQAAAQTERAWDYFRTVPEAEAHMHWGDSRESTLDGSSINVLIWNIKKAEVAAWTEEFKALGKNKNLFVLQEGYDSDHFFSVTRSFTDIRWDMGKSFTYVLYDNHATGTVLGSSVSPETVSVKHTRDLEPVTFTPKTLISATYSLSHRKDNLLVIDVHGINFTGQQEFENNLAQIREKVLPHSGPVLIAGDFNTRTKERTTAMQKMMKDLKFTEVKWKNGHQRMKAYLTPHYLDHAFVRGLKVKEAIVHGQAKGSDHKPMTLSLSVPVR